MSQTIADRNRMEIRQAIGLNTGKCIVGEATSDGSSTTIIDTYNLAKFNDDDIIGRQVMVTSAGTSAASVGQKAFVTDFVASSDTITHAPAMDGAVKDGQQYEMWEPPYSIERVNEMINSAIIGVTDDCLQEKIDATVCTERDRYRYTIPTGYKGIHTVQYVSANSENDELSDCETAWTAGTNATVAVDTEMYRRGSGCNKITVVAGASTNELIAYKNITSIDLSNKNTIEFWFRSSIAMVASSYQLLLDDTAACASAVESLNLPAITANTWTRCQLTLSNPHLDTAIISVGLKQVTDVGACYLWIDDVRAVNTVSRVYQDLPASSWSIVKGSTAYLQLNSVGKSLVGQDAVLQLKGYDAPAIFSDDATDSEVDPDYIINKVTGQILHAFEPEQAQYYLSLAESRLPSIRTVANQNTRWMN